MLEQSFPNVARCHADDGVFAGVVGRGTTEEFDPDHALFQGFEVTCDGLVHDIAQKLSATLAASECGTFHNLTEMLLQLSANLFGPRDALEFDFSFIDRMHGITG
ncbi:hypothetical protein [Edaphobacter albus]|uniref:hypothetical protein n=1 Tax=Edaphobacter sp. 4G125 TaxID=2763071 RepID=UPI001647AA33|nr:hypothetical protein [Edaphobacter sp. 4G125]QNI37980.1 hypothetical protein H7846_06885 [Edaphobacter sp. 4G125]